MKTTTIRVRSKVDIRLQEVILCEAGHGPQIAMFQRMGERKAWHVVDVVTGWVFPEPVCRPYARQSGEVFCSHFQSVLDKLPQLNVLEVSPNGVKFAIWKWLALDPSAPCGVVAKDRCPFYFRAWEIAGANRTRWVIKFGEKTYEAQWVASILK